MVTFLCSLIFLNVQLSFKLGMLEDHTATCPGVQEANASNVPFLSLEIFLSKANNDTTPELGFTEVWSSASPYIALQLNTNMLNPEYFLLHSGIKTRTNQKELTRRVLNKLCFGCCWVTLCWHLVIDKFQTTSSYNVSVMTRSSLPRKVALCGNFLPLSQQKNLELQPYSTCGYTQRE